MRVVLCHHCWTWVFPQGTQCGECKSVIALDEPDPAADELGRLLGTVSARLANVVWERPKLPSHAELWGTTTGLLYWPLLIQQPNGSIVPPANMSRPASPWSLFSLWRPTNPARSVDTPLESWTPLPQTGTALGQSFLDAPGAAFFPRENVVKIACRSRSWTLHRTIGRALRLTVQPQVTPGAPSWKDFFQQDAWRSIAVVS